MKTFLRSLAVLLVGLVAFAGLTACGKSKVALGEGCFEQLSYEHGLELSKRHPDLLVTEPGEQESGVCLISDGEQRYLDDDERDYPTYALLQQRANALATAQQYDANNYEFEDELVFVYFVSLDSKGYLYKPFSKKNGRWHRKPVKLNNRRVGAVRYGSGPPTRWAPPSKRATPPGYRTSGTLPKPTQKVGTRLPPPSGNPPAPGALPPPSGNRPGTPGTLPPPKASAPKPAAPAPKPASPAPRAGGSSGKVGR